MDTHKQMPWHTKKLEEVYQVVNTSEKGLSDTEAAERLKQNGKNELRAKPPENTASNAKRANFRPNGVYL